MKIKHITLKNIGPYKGINSLNFNTDDKKNIILIGGNNGSGKTTLLKAIKYGLFGSYSFGFKNDSVYYINEIKQLLNYEEIKSNDFSISLDLEMVENFERKIYSIKRFWFYIDEELIENLQIKENSNQLNDYESLEFQEKLKFLTSPELINCYIFDGEKIGNIIENNKMNLFLKETFESIFNINIIKQLSKDLNSYIEKKTTEDLSEEEVTSFSLLNEINSIKKKIKIEEDDLDVLNEKKTDIEIKKKSLHKTFMSLGGLNKIEQKQFEEQIIMYNRDKEINYRFLKNFLENDLPFAMNLDLFKKALNQIDLEKPVKYYKSVDKISEYLKIDLSHLKEKLSLNIETYELLHNVDDEAISNLKNRYNSIKENYEITKKLLKVKEENSVYFKIIKQKLINNNQENYENFDKLINEIQDLDNSTAIIINQINLKTKLCNDLKLTLNNLLKQYEIVSDNLKKVSSKDNSYIMSINTLNINNKFVEYLTEKKLNEVSMLTLNIFNDTIRKKDFLSNLLIDSYFNISLFDSNEKQINIHNLSAGEKQLLIASIIWSIFKISGRKETFIFDTPLARLDKENRVAFINNIIKTVSSEVIILSTDSEFVESNFYAIKDNVASFYNLDYDEKNKSTQIKKGYFLGVNYESKIENKL